MAQHITHTHTGEVVPMVWISPVMQITDEIKRLMREKLAPFPIMFNGRLFVSCACVAGGPKGGVTRDNIEDVMMEFERYFDGTKYNKAGRS